MPFSSCLPLFFPLLTSLPHIPLSLQISKVLQPEPGLGWSVFMLQTTLHMQVGIDKKMAQPGPPSLTTVSLQPQLLWQLLPWAAATMMLFRCRDVSCLTAEDSSDLIPLPRARPIQEAQQGPVSAAGTSRPLYSQLCLLIFPVSLVFHVWGQVHIFFRKTRLLLLKLLGQHRTWFQNVRIYFQSFSWFINIVLIVLNLYPDYF